MTAKNFCSDKKCDIVIRVLIEESKKTEIISAFNNSIEHLMLES